MAGVSPQAYYSKNKKEEKGIIKEELVLKEAKEIRKKMPKCGGRKMHEILKDKLSKDLMVGRDELFNILGLHNMLIRQRKIRIRTTNSNHPYKRYTNLIKDFAPNAANQLWVSDITYIRTEEVFCYLSLITDAYSRKIVGWAIGDTLEAKHTIKALRMALKQRKNKTESLIHHSDRGIQYCCESYIKILNSNNVKISMTESGDPRDNAIAERVNGILKNEWIKGRQYDNLESVKTYLKQIIKYYNNYRPHSSIDYLCPSVAHKMKGKIDRKWKNYYPN